MYLIGVFIRFEQLLAEDSEVLYTRRCEAKTLLKGIVFLAWAWLSKAKGHSCHTKNHILPKPFTEKMSKSAKYPWPLGYKKDPLKITMHLGLDDN